MTGHYTKEGIERSFLLPNGVKSKRSVLVDLLNKTILIGLCYKDETYLIQ